MLLITGSYGRSKRAAPISLNGPYTTSNTSTTSTYIATGLNNGQAYYFWVQANNGSLSAYTNGIGATPTWPVDTGNITGQVMVDVAGYDSLGVKNATVSLQGTGFSTTTENDGTFTLVNVPFGDYQIVVNAPDMDPIIQDISLNGQTLTVPIPSMVIDHNRISPMGMRMKMGRWAWKTPSIFYICLRISNNFFIIIRKI